MTYKCDECKDTGKMEIRVGGDGYGGRCCAQMDAETDCIFCAPVFRPIGGLYRDPDVTMLCRAVAAKAYHEALHKTGKCPTCCTSCHYPCHRARDLATVAICGRCACPSCTRAEEAGERT